MIYQLRSCPDCRFERIVSQQIYRMYNRHTFERNKSMSRMKLDEIIYQKAQAQQKKEKTVQMVEHYKSRVRDFLVHIASNPIVLGQYQPPIKQIKRSVSEDRILANAQLYINGFKTNKERVNQAVYNNQILDNTPLISSARNYSYRDRKLTKEIQKGMHFAGLTNSESVPKLPSINPEHKMHFKGVEEMGNSLKSMKQKQIDKIGLINRLQTVYGGKEINLEKSSLEVLQQCKLLTKKVVKNHKKNTV